MGMRASARSSSGVALQDMGAVTSRPDRNIEWRNSAVSKFARAQMKGQKACCLWFTGLSGAGKTTLANLLDETLHKDGFHTYVLDGDRCRDGLCRDLNFSLEDRMENVRRVSEVAKLMVDAGLIVMVSLISPLILQRQMARQLFEQNEFLEVFVNTPLAICEMRDPKGLYRKARDGLIPNFTGISSAYEMPKNAEIVLDGRLKPNDLIEQVRRSMARHALVRDLSV
jgi:adenylyl-sulfate kinase